MTRTDSIRAWLRGYCAGRSIILDHTQFDYAVAVLADDPLPGMPSHGRATLAAIFAAYHENETSP